MSYEDQAGNRREKTYRRMRSGMHIGMGIFYVIIGSAILYVKYFGTIELSTGLAYTLGSLMVLYGIFRLWRGFTDMKAKD